MKISVFILMLSLLTNLSFANLSGDSFTGQANFTNMDTSEQESLMVVLVGDWTKISQDELDWGFSSLSLFSDGNFKGTTSAGIKVCGTWEVTTDGAFMAMHQFCEETGEKTGTILAQIEMADGHTLTLSTLGAKASKQTFIQ